MMQQDLHSHELIGQQQTLRERKTSKSPMRHRNQTELKEVKEVLIRYEGGVPFRLPAILTQSRAGKMIESDT